MKFCLNYLKREEDCDIIIVHDVNLPYIDEKIIRNLTAEALKNGVSCLATSDVIEHNLLFKLDEKNIEEDDENDLNMKKIFRSVSVNGALSSDYMDSKDFRIGYKPQAFQYSIFKMMFDNVRFIIYQS